MNEDATDPLVFWLIEEWSSTRDLNNHCSSTAYADISARYVLVRFPNSLCGVGNLTRYILTFSGKPKT